MYTVLQFQDVYVLVRTAEQQQRLFVRENLNVKAASEGRL